MTECNCSRNEKVLKSVLLSIGFTLAVMMTIISVNILFSRIFASVDV